MAAPKGSLKILRHEFPELGNHLRETSRMELHTSAEVRERRGSLSSVPSSQGMTTAVSVLKRSYTAGEHDRQGAEALTKERPFVPNNSPSCPLNAHLTCHHEVTLSLLFQYVLVRILFCWIS